MGIEKEYFLRGSGEIQFNFIILEMIIARNYFLQQITKLRDVPLVIEKFE